MNQIDSKFSTYSRKSRIIQNHQVYYFYFFLTMLINYTFSPMKKQILNDHFILYLATNFRLYKLSFLNQGKRQKIP